MRKTINFNQGWQFVPNASSIDEACFTNAEKIHLPHTWNGEDGQDGGGDYLRTTCLYIKHFDKPECQKDDEVYIEFNGVNSEAEVYLNEHKLISHEGGYSRFRCNLTSRLKEKNILVVKVCNAANNHVYPQTADFTFYGGIYRDVNLIIVGKNHFDLSYYGSLGFKADPVMQNEKDASLSVKGYVKGEGEVSFHLYDEDDKEVAVLNDRSTNIIKDVHLWNGRKDPYLYKLVARLTLNEKVEDEVSDYIGFRSFSLDPKKGFILNHEPYALRGVSRHQDRPHIGNALTKKDHEDDMALINEIGATTIRLAHYQHDSYFYHLCDASGQVVWSEIPYISKHMELADENALEQMKELIIQTYHNPSICFRGISNEITMKKASEDRYEEHIKLNNLVHELDPHRYSVIAGFVMISDWNKLNFLTDAVSLNLYYGWYAPFTWLNSVRFGLFHFFYPKRPIGLSEYGAEAMTNLHSEHPHRFDNSEEYQAIYHEKLLKIIAKRPYLWATHVWNMFDFGADGRNQGGDPGKNHKGLVSFDRKIKKDAFYIYKAYWSNDPFVHLCGSRFINRNGHHTKIKVYSNQKEVSLFVNDKLISTKKGNKVFSFKVRLEPNMKVEAKSGSLVDKMNVHKVNKKDPTYVSHAGNSYSWEKKKATKIK
ncbi:MAG: glycoside hydrolase family 2 protein [Bacilli bacterium]|jgi:beta-galactosidase|nr:glycoside hydrolase family 2 protein [Bacilli bacterium]MCH4210799.1 glycoside hydrolase family 2 protein [Bacilli bacterium]MCH4278306.1 glycoside hydrolase family 2 protein [Bacilli bacterium]